MLPRARGRPTMTGRGARPFHLPGLDDPGGLPLRRGRTAAGWTFAVPRLGADHAASVAATVRSAAMRARRERSTAGVVEAASRAAGRLVDPGDEVGRRARELLARELGWPGELVAETLEGMGRVWSERALLEVLEVEVGGASALDGFGDGEPVPSASAAAVPGGIGRRRRAASGPPLQVVIAAANVPGVAVTAAIRGLVARSGLLLKAPEAEPGLLPLFGRVLAEEDPLLGACLAATWWPGGSDAAEERAWTSRAGLVVVYGGADAVRHVRRAAAPHADLLAYGPRIGVGVVLPDAAGGGGPWPGRLARDVCAYEQQGCVSPRVVYVLGEEPSPFAEALASALEEEVRRLPRPSPTEEEAVALRSLRAEAEFREYAAEGRDAGRGPAPAGGPGGAALSGGDAAGWTVLVEGSAPPRSEGLPRLVRVHPAAGVGRLEELLRPVEGRLQAVGYAGARGAESVARLASRLGAARVAPFGTVAWPPADWRHDGRHQILPLLRWTDWEGPAG